MNDASHSAHLDLLGKVLARRETNFGHLMHLEQNGILDLMLDNMADPSQVGLVRSALGYDKLITRKAWSIKIDYSTTFLSRLHTLTHVLDRLTNEVVATDELKKAEPSPRQTGSHKFICETVHFNGKASELRQSEELQRLGLGMANVDQFVAVLTAYIWKFRKTNRSVYIQTMEGCFGLTWTPKQDPIISSHPRPYYASFNADLLVYREF